MSFYDSIELTPQEVEAALLEARKKKYFHEKNKSYWIQQEQNAVLKGEEEKRIAKLKRASLKSQAQIDQVTNL